MSKSAMKTLESAEKIIEKSGVIVVPFVEFFNSAKTRKHKNKFLWRNSDLLASLIVKSAANAFQSETKEDLANNGFEDMRQAITCYIDSNLEYWDQKDWEQFKGSRDTKGQIDRLSLLVDRWIEYHKTK